MALPQDGQDANGLTKVTQIPAGKELMFIDPTTNEGGIITLEDLTKQILNGLLSQTFALDAGQKTIIQALNTLNSESQKKFNGNISSVVFRSGSSGIDNAYLDFYTTDGKRTTIGFYTDGMNGIQMMKDNALIWSIKA